MSLKTRVTGADTSNCSKNQQTSVQYDSSISPRAHARFLWNAYNAPEFRKVSQLSHGRHFIIFTVSQNVRKNWGDPSLGYYPVELSFITVHYLLLSISGISRIVLETRQRPRTFLILPVALCPLAILFRSRSHRSTSCPLPRNVVATWKVIEAY